MIDDYGKGLVERRRAMNLVDYELGKSGKGTQWNTKFFKSGVDNPMNDVVVKQKVLEKTKGKKLSAERKQQISESMKNSLLVQYQENAVQAGRGDKYIVTNPNGNEEYVSFITNWSNDRGLSASHLRSVAMGNRKHHKQYRARFATVEEILANEWKELKGILFESEIKELVLSKLAHYDYMSKTYEPMDIDTPHGNTGRVRGKGNEE